MAGSEPLPLSATEPTPSTGATVEHRSLNPPTSPPASPMPAQAQIPPPQNIGRLILIKARAVIRLRKQKKLAKIMGLLAKQTSITNDEVEKLLHVSDTTATRYLSELEKRGKITQKWKNWSRSDLHQTLT